MKRILFVDDDLDLLNGLRARLHKHRANWEMKFVDSGAAALIELKAGSVDLVVTDVRMPGMDGGQLLATIKEGWPETIRIVMSGYSEPVKVLQLVSLAHRYISKPCDAQQLENIIERCFKLDSVLRGEELKNLVGRIGKLPALPKTYQQLKTALSQPNVQATVLADIITRDPIVTAKVLQVANSAFFRLAKPVQTIKQAVNYLGFACIQNLVMSAEVFSEWGKIPNLPGLDPDRLQENAQQTAAACKALAVGTPLVDDALLVGLLHDIGYWVLLQECPKDMAHILKLATDTGVSFEQAERDVIGTSHAEVGAYLLGLWGFPYEVVEAVAFHHRPSIVEQRGFDLLAILSVAHSLMPSDAPYALGIESEKMPIVDSNYFEQLSPPYSWQEAQQRVSDIGIVE